MQMVQMFNLLLDSYISNTDSSYEICHFPPTNAPERLLQPSRMFFYSHVIPVLDILRHYKMAWERVKFLFTKSRMCHHLMLFCCFTFTKMHLWCL